MKTELLTWSPIIISTIALAVSLSQDSRWIAKWRGRKIYRIQYKIGPTSKQESTNEEGKCQFYMFNSYILKRYKDKAGKVVITKIIQNTEIVEITFFA
tara:strand:+ start:5658 stop:5951 length:294 start_codon:yes stop_codon:yes gene_type:complete